MVEVYYNTQRKDLAVDTLEKVVKLRPANVPYVLALADLYFEINDVENAQRYYFRVLEYEPSNIKAKAQLQKIV
jgi:tetratricopeptide (TPR) repeat protein